MLQTSRLYNLRIPRIKNANLSGYHLHINTNIQGDFQICISVPLKEKVVVNQSISRITHIR